MKEKGDQVRLIHILEHANTIPEWLSGVSKNTFFTDKQLQAAIIRQLDCFETASRLRSNQAATEHLPRLKWQRKPQTQVVPNKKALQKKSACRKSKTSRQA